MHRSIILLQYLETIQVHYPKKIYLLPIYMNYKKDDIVIGEWKRNTMDDFRKAKNNYVHQRATDVSKQDYFDNFMNFRQYTNIDSHTNNHYIRINEYVQNPDKYNGQTIQQVYDSLTTEFKYSQKSPELDQLFGVNNKSKF